MNYLYVIKDLELRGNLRSVLETSRKKGLSIREIADELSKKGAVISKSTVAVWVQHLENEGNN